MIPDCDGRTVRRSDGQTESIIAKTALCIASYVDALSKRNGPKATDFKLGGTFTKSIRTKAH